MRSRSKSFSSSAAVRSSSAVSSASPDSSTSSSVARRSSTRAWKPRHRSISERRPSASRRIFWARRWSFQNSGSLVSASSWATRCSFASRSKTPRGRPDPLGQAANRGRVHSVAGLEVLEQDRTELDQPKGGLAPGDDGVHAGTVAVVRADAAVAVTVERCRVAARSAIAFTGDEIDKRCFLGLLQLVPLSCMGRVGARCAVRLRDRRRSRVRGNFGKYRASIHDGQEAKPEVSAFGPIVLDPAARLHPGAAISARCGPVRASGRLTGHEIQREGTELVDRRVGPAEEGRVGRACGRWRPVGDDGLVAGDAQDPQHVGPVGDEHGG